MSEPQATPQTELTETEHQILLTALDGPLLDHDPAIMGACLRLCNRRLLQRAGGVSAANGWRGSLHAFVLSRDGWNLLKAERRRAPIQRTG
jgi:hypothetical protein